MKRIEESGLKRNKYFSPHFLDQVNMTSADDVFPQS